MKEVLLPQDQNFWYLKRPDTLALHEHTKTEIVIIGGGMAGLTTAQAFAKKGKKVILLEAYYCGAGASGKSSGFIQPNCEMNLSEFVNRYGIEAGKTIWNAIEQNGVEHIRTTIKQYKLECDYTEQDSLDVASSPSDVKNIRQEAEYLAQFGYATQFIKKKEIPTLLGSEKYYGGVLYPNSFGINGYKYCQEMKNILVQQGVTIYEETPVLSIQDHCVTTLHGSVKADYVIVCADRFIPTFEKLTKEIYHVQNFLLATETLTQDVIQKIFPQKKVMICDTELIYNFYRMTGDRLLVGGGSLFNVYNKSESYHSNYMYKKLSHYIKSTFPCLDVQFEHMWPGLIGISKDIAPITGFDKKLKSLYYIGAATGLPIAAMLGNYCAHHIIDGDDTLKDYFSPYRKFLINGAAQTILGTKATFALSNWIAQRNHV